MGLINEEEVILNLVVNGGDGRGKALQAIDAAHHHDMKGAEALLNESNEALLKAHKYQTELLQRSIGEDGAGSSPSLLVVHGQDHLMTAMLAYDIAVKMVEMYRLFYTQHGEEK